MGQGKAKGYFLARLIPAEDYWEQGSYRVFYTKQDNTGRGHRSSSRYSARPRGTMARCHRRRGLLERRAALSVHRSAWKECNAETIVSRGGHREVYLRKQCGPHFKR